VFYGSQNRPKRYFVSGRKVDIANYLAGHGRARLKS